MGEPVERSIPPDLLTADHADLADKAENTSSHPHHPRNPWVIDV
jgi:hypothetical protein